MYEQPKFIIFDKRENVLESLARDFITFGLLLLCIWASQGSKWWTFFTGLMFIVFLGAKFLGIARTSQIKFRDLDEMQDWLNKERSNT